MNNPIKRAENGRFAVGHSGGPGRKPKAVESRYLDSLQAAITPGDLSEVWRVVFEKAVSGDVAAAKLILNYAVGLPSDSATEARIAELERTLDALEQSRN